MLQNGDFEFDHNPTDGYRVALDCEYLVLDADLRPIPLKFRIELEWEDDEDDGNYNLRLIDSSGRVEHFLSDEFGSDGREYQIEGYRFPELVGRAECNWFSCESFDIFVDLTVSSFSRKVYVHLVLYQNFRYT